MSNNNNDSLPPQQARSSSSPGVLRNQAPAASQHCLPISVLNRYTSPNWRIKARVTNKSDIRESHKDGKNIRFLFAFVVDSSAEIRIVAFNEAVDKFDQLLQVDQVRDFRLLPLLANMF